MDQKTVNALIKKDKILAKTIKKVGPITLSPKLEHPPYRTLVESIVFQQLSTKAASTILKRFVALYPKKRFPTPQDILDSKVELIRSAGLSNAKTLAVKDIALKTIEGVVPTTKKINTLSDEEIIERLTVIRGVGPWTVHMLLIFKLGRPDILPTTDYGVRKGHAKVYGLSELLAPKDLEEFGERWAPYRSTAAWYLWRSLDL